MNYEEKTISRKHIYKGNIISMESQTVELPDGREATRDVVLHPGASVIIPLSENGELYMVKQFRKPIDTVTLEIPAGKLDNGEDPMVCAERELKEETGLRAESIIHMISIHSSPGFSNEILHMYLATGLKEGSLCADDDEFITSQKIPVGVLVNMVMTGEITDAKSIIGILLAERIIRNKGLQY
ncbi:MAG: NUDIX hydrolase [Ruminiclostridium sp.]|nr:NUDIX hydrolase [Ruminiclostridium sp.]